MNRSFQIGENSVSVKFGKGIIRLRANYALRNIIKTETNGLETLVAAIKKEYKNIYKTSLQIKNDSLTMEIVGHLRTYKLTLFLRKIFSIGLLRKMSYHVCKIDCGEKRYDGNRWIWDCLAVLNR